LLLYFQVRNNENMTEKCLNLTNIKSEARASAETFPGGQHRNFAYPFHVADDAMQLHVHKTLCPFYTTKMPPAAQERNEGGKGGHDSPSAESLCGRQITAGGAIKSQQYHKYFLQYSRLHLLPKDLRFEHGSAKPASCPRCHLTSLRPCCYGSSRKNCASLAQQCFFSHCTVQNYEACHY